MLSSAKPFLPAKENFNIVWIETREGDIGASGIPPALYTLTISDFLTPKRAKTELNLKHARLAAFGSTRHVANKPEDDDNVQKLVGSETPVVTIFGKSWNLHTERARQVAMCSFS